MGLITEEVEVSLGGKNIKWYEDKGYLIPRIKDKRDRIVTRYGTKILVNIKDLPDKSHIKINYICDHCRKEYETTWYNYNIYKKEEGNFYCNKCAHKLYGAENIRINRLKSGLSFEQWCNDNNRKDVLNRWDYDLNKYKPSEISYSSNILIYLKCEKGIHNSEEKSICNFTSGQGGSIKCNACNSIGQWLKNNYGEDAIKKYWSDKNKEDPFNVDFSSNKNIILICQNCKEEKEITPNNYTNRENIACHQCSDGISYGEKFMKSFLKQINEEHISQLSKKHFKWCYKYKYDEYLIKNVIVEIHGKQHYEESGFEQTLDEIQRNDEMKKKLAYLNGFTDDNYIIIDARCSTLKHIKQSIIESELPQILNFKQKDIDWEQCNKDALSSFVKVACDLWEDGIRNTLKISHLMNMSRPTITKYLKQGANLNLCDYNVNYCNKKVYCIELDIFFNSITEAVSELGIDKSHVSDCCKGVRKTTGGYHWMYHEDYLKLHNETNEVETINT